jgi:GxxExxY protein
MPIECEIEIEAVDQDEFHQLDKSVMRHAFDIHNSMGRFCDERIYQNELATRCQSSGFESAREVEIRLTHGSFSKSYFADLLINRSVIYELKAAETLAPAHENQLINYLLLTDTRHGKILNLRSPSVQSRFVSTTMTRQDRMKYRLNATAWANNNIAANDLRNHLLGIIEDWGVCLDLNAYREALLHVTSGPDSGLLPVAIHSPDRIIGFQKMCLLTPDTAWHLTALKSSRAPHEKHVLRLLSHTRLKRLHWINLNQNEIHFRTIKNDSVFQ